jgi:hypothetical protein
MITRWSRDVCNLTCDVDDHLHADQLAHALVHLLLLAQLVHLIYIYIYIYIHITSRSLSIW